MKLAGTALYSAHANGLAASPAGVLAAALDRISSHSMTAETLFRTDPHTGQVAVRLAEYIMHAVPEAPGTSGSLLELCLKDGLSRVEEEGYGLLPFVEGILASIHRVASWHVFVRRRNHTVSWDCCSGSMYSWLVSHGCPNIRVAPRPEGIGEHVPSGLVRAMAALRVLSADDMRVLGSALDSVLVPNAC